MKKSIKTIGEAIRKRRTSSGMTQQELADRADITQSHMGWAWDRHWEMEGDP